MEPNPRRLDGPRDERLVNIARAPRINSAGAVAPCSRIAGLLVPACHLLLRFWIRADIYIYIDVVCGLVQLKGLASWNLILQREIAKRSYDEFKTICKENDLWWG